MLGRGPVKNDKVAKHIVNGVNDTMRLEGFEPDDGLTKRLMLVVTGQMTVEEAKQRVLKQLKEQRPYAFR